MTLANTETTLIPDVTGLSVREAVDAYRAAGLIVFPVIPGTKEPAVRWKQFKLDDPWPEGDYSIGLGMNINHLVAVDVDHPERLPEEMRHALPWAALQSTDAGAEGVLPRGHYVWRSSEDWSNSTAGFPGSGWGDVRGGGFLVVEPSPHPREDGAYRWQRRGIPSLSTRVEGWLTKAGDATSHGNDDDLAEFLDRFTETHDLDQLDQDMQPYRDRVAAGEPRNNVLPSAMGKTYRMAVNGWYPAQAAYDACEDLANTPDPYDEGRYEAMAGRFARTAMDDPGDYKPFKPVIISESGSRDFWSRRRTLQTIHQAAKARMIGPFGLLGAVLVDVVAAIPPEIEIDTYGGDHASLNTFIALVGPSGAGKSRIATAVRDVIDIPDRTFWQSLRSGEGLVSMFVQKRGREIERVADSAVIDMDEVDRLTALGDRSGATIMPTLRTAWVAGTLGGRAATSGLDLVLEHSSYRCNLVAGVQPGRSKALLNDADGGTPQRFVWLPANDPQAELDWEWPEPLEWGTEEPPAVLEGVVDLFGSQPKRWTPSRNLTLPESVIAEWKQDALMRARGQGDPLDAHRFLATAKIAAALALLEMREDVDLEDWELAQHIMRVSTITRDGLKAMIAEQSAIKAKTQGRLEGMRQAAAELSADAARVERISARVIKVLTEAGDWVPRAALNRKLSSRDRPALDDALDHLIEAGRVERREHDGGGAYLWKGGSECQ